VSGSESLPPPCWPFTYRPVNDGPSLRDAVRKALDAWHRSGDTYRFGVDVQNVVAAFDYNTKKANRGGQRTAVAGTLDRLCSARDGGDK
jgi:hypothetical protein